AREPPARAPSWSIAQSSTATPTIGQSRSPRCSSLYSEWKVMTFARSPVMPKTTRTAAGSVVGVLTILRPLLLPLLVRSDADPAHALVRQLASGPVDDRLRAVLVRREEREVPAPQADLRLAPLHRPPAEHRDDRRVASDRGHRALVAVRERLRRLARHAAGDRLAGRRLPTGERRT